MKKKRSSGLTSVRSLPAEKHPVKNSSLSCEFNWIYF